MNNCKHLTDYAAQLLKGKELEEFLQHLDSCQACKMSIEENIKLDNSLKKMWEKDLYPRVSIEKAKTISDLPLRRSQKLKWILWSGGIGTTIAILLLLFIFPGGKIDNRDNYIKKVELISIVSQKGSPLYQTNRDLTKEFIVSKGESLVFNHGEDRIGLSENSRLKIIYDSKQKESLSLIKGIISLQVKPRDKNNFLSIKVGDYLVTVIGTQFSLGYDGVNHLKVSVSKGKVKVTTPKKGDFLITKNHGISLLSGKVASIVEISPTEKSNIEDILNGSSIKTAKNIPKVIKTPTLNKINSTRSIIVNSLPKKDLKVSNSHKLNKSLIKKWIISGKYKKAEKELVLWLKIRPTDGYLWWLLGECRRKSAKLRKAVYAYAKCSKAGGQYANRARYKSAVLYQDSLGNNSKAVTLLRLYIKQPKGAKPLMMEAKLRLASGLLSIGKRDKAKNMLKNIIKNYSKSIYSLRAKKMMESIK
jgi:FecR protein/Tetratricopeptide repeat